MRKLLLLAPLAVLIGAPIAAAPASAQSITIRTDDDRGGRGYDRDRGFERDRGMDRGRGYGRERGMRGDRVVERRVRRDDVTGSTRTVKKVTRTNEFGDRVTRKTIRVDD